MHQRLRHRAHGQEGFTLIELLVVILIIGILAAVAIPTFLSQTGKAKDSNIQSNLNTVQTAEATYNTTANAYTSSLTTLASTEPAVKGFSSSNGGNIAISTSTVPTGVTDPITGTANSSSLAYSASGYAGSSSSSAVTYYLTVYTDGGVADTCSVPANTNAGACNAPGAGGSSAVTGTWGNGNS